MELCAQEALKSWSWPGTPKAERLASGLINESYRVEVAGRPVAALQRLNTEIFDPRVLEDIHALTEHLAAHSFPTPRLLQTRNGDLGLHIGAKEVWRCYSWVGSQTVDTVSGPAMAESSASLVARFHAASTNFDWEFRNRRPDPHDTPTHMARLRDALQEHRAHRLYDEIAPIAERILEGWSKLPPMVELPERVIHGDLKISNLRFDDERAVAIIDLDTISHGRIDAELGDALRSWCNAAGEDCRIAELRMDLFEATIEGYADGCPADASPSPEEWSSIIPGWLRITIELASRFASDALRESYFGWDPQFGTRGDHCLLRACGQLSLFEAIDLERQNAERALERTRR